MQILGKFEPPAITVVRVIVLISIDSLLYIQVKTGMEDMNISNSSTPSTDTLVIYLDFIQEVVKDGEMLLVIHSLVGTLSFFINSFQLWFLKNKFRRELNSLFVIIRHLSLADFLNGFFTLSHLLLCVIEREMFPNNTILMLLINYVSLMCIR